MSQVRCYFCGDFFNVQDTRRLTVQEPSVQGNLWGMGQGGIAFVNLTRNERVDICKGCDAERIANLIPYGQRLALNKKSWESFWLAILIIVAFFLTCGMAFIEAFCLLGYLTSGSPP